MAEIHVERKRSMSPIVLILVVLVLLALGWLAYSMYVTREEAAQPAPAATTTTSVAPAGFTLAA